MPGARYMVPKKKVGTSLQLTPTVQAFLDSFAVSRSAACERIIRETGEFKKYQKTS